MRKSVSGIISVVIAVVIIGLFAFRDEPLPSRPQNASNAKPSSTPLSSNQVNNMSPAVAEYANNRNDQAADANDDDRISRLEERYAEVSNNPDYPQLQTRLDAMRQRHNKTFEAEEVVDVLAQPEAWVRVDEPPQELPLTPVEKYDGREFIRFNPARVETLMPGDTLEIPVWQLGTRFIMRVDRTETHGNGSVTWHGHLENFNEPHRVTITVGDGLSLGGIDTPNGHYVLQANGESGWIASSETLFKRNEAETDMIIPPSGELEENP